MSLEFKKMMETILQKKSEMTPEEVRDLIDEKKRKIGAGYLTDQGALFLVAADLGVSFENNQDVQSSIKDLYIGSKDFNLIARVINIYPIKRYTRKDTNEEIRNRTITIYDTESSIKVRLWDNHVNFPEESNLRPGDLVKISHGYIKSGFDNKPVINLGIKGSIQAINLESEIPTLDLVTKTIDDIREPIDNIVITGLINSNPRISRYVNFRNEPGKSLQMTLSNESNSRSLRSVIWNINEERIPTIFKQGSRLKLIGVRVKEGNPQYSNDEFEIHGDEGTIIQLLDTDKGEAEGEKDENDNVLVLRIVSNVTRSENNSNINVLAVDKKRNLLSVVIDPKLLTEENVKSDLVIEGVPNKIFGNVIYFTDENSFIRVINNSSGIDEDSVPDITELESKIKDIQKSDNPYIIEAIILQPPNTTEITTKTGENVTVSDTLIGDDTGEIRLTAWRDQGIKITKLNVGDRVKIVGAVPGMNRENKIEITLKPFSEVRKVN